MSYLFFKIFFVLVSMVRVGRGSSSMSLCRQVIHRRSLDTCKLHHYQQADAVACFDTDQTPDTRRFAFIGDSRIRQHFFSFVQMFPDYDYVWKGKFHYSRVHKTHNDMGVSSDILGISIDFFWRRIIGPQLLEQLRHWTLGSTATRPSFILIGIAVHHMLRENGADPNEYQRQLKKLCVVLKKLSSVSDILWIDQYPIIEKFGWKGDHNVDIHSGKVHDYNIMARRTLRDCGVEFWNSSSILAEEYIRSCHLNHRNDSLSYRDCGSYVHPGFSVIDAASQILMNYLCNKSLLSSSPITSVPIGPDYCCANGTRPADIKRNH